MEILRTELYERVWTTPMSKLAREFDISDVGLAKVCASYGIPRPPRGYWARAAAGRVPPRPPLPPSRSEIVRFNPEQHRVRMTTTDAVSRPVVPIPMLGPDDALPPVASATLERLRKTKPSMDGFVRCGSPRVFTCALSTATIERAGRILGSIEHALPAIGGRLKKSDKAPGIGILVGGEWIGISIAEDYRRTETVLQDPKIAWLKQREYSYHFTGALRLTIAADFNGRKSWGDGKRARLEEKIDSIVTGLLVASTGIVELRREREEQRRRWQEEARLAELARERQRRRQHFLDKLHEEANSWSAHREIQEYVDHLRQHLGSADALPPASLEWIELAEELAKAVDPTSKRLQLLREGITGYDYYMPFGRSVDDG
jgi:hypothetical protein